MTREELIEEAAKGMYFEDCGMTALGDDAEPFREMARVALGVFEEAYRVSARDLHMASLPNEEEWD